VIEKLIKSNIHLSHPSLSPSTNKSL